jgi:hypothetical protein
MVWCNNKYGSGGWGGGVKLSRRGRGITRRAEAENDGLSRFLFLNSSNDCGSELLKRGSGSREYTYM